MLRQQTKLPVRLYARLSKDDGDADKESNSIAVVRKAVRTQKASVFNNCGHILLQMKGNDYGTDLYKSRRLLHPEPCS